MTANKTFDKIFLRQNKGYFWKAEEKTKMKEIRKSQNSFGSTRDQPIRVFKMKK
jgi:hypothetical protein